MKLDGWLASLTAQWPAKHRQTVDPLAALSDNSHNLDPSDQYALIIINALFMKRQYEQDMTMYAKIQIMWFDVENNDENDFK